MIKILPYLKETMGVGALLLLLQPAFAQMVWTKPEALNAGLPASVEVFMSTTPIAPGINTKAYYTIADLTDPALELKAAYATGAAAKTTTQYFNAEPTSERAYVAINGGFFGGGQSFSYVAQGGNVLAPNVKLLNRDFNGTSTPYYPTRGAFGILANNTPDVAWIYSVDAANTTTYSYTAPSPNRLGQAPQPAPTTTFPTAGTLWNPSVGIGGSPVLVEASAKRITDVEELIVIDNDSRRARTAVGYTSDKKVIMLVVEGNNPGVSAGATLNELADIMVSLGAVEALNLDGGGTSTMVVKGDLTIRPSDGAERVIPSSLILKQRAPEPIIYDTHMAGVYSERGTGNWRNTANGGFFGTSQARIVEVSAAKTNVAKYVFTNLEPGRYEVSTWTVTSSNRSSATPFTMYQSGVAQPVVTINQAIPANNSVFTMVGTYDLRANDSLLVTDNIPGATGSTFITTDAIRLVKVGTLASIKKSALASSVQVYPVPTGGQITVDLPEALRKGGQVQVVNLLGTTVFRKDTLASGSLEIDLAPVPAGMYLVVVESPAGRVVKRVLKR